MVLKEFKPRKALNKAFLKVKPNRNEIEVFKNQLIVLLDRTNETESEEFHKNLVSDFLKKTYYDPNHFINTKGRNDLVIHNGPNASTTVGVILETKKPTNKAEMISTKKLNAKALQELVLYYLRERITHKNLEVKHLVATNITEWFIFDAALFDRLFAQNKNLVKQFIDFEAGRLADTKTDFFYKQVAEPFIEGINAEIEFTYFNLQDFQKPLRNKDKADDNSLIALFKLLSPEHLLKLPFTNDSNSLDKRFYSELLHIIGLTETKEGSKKLIERNKVGDRNSGTILEDAIIQLDSLDKLSRIEKPSQFGNNQQERLFNVALELSITWINRILFLKLLEAQLITYHKGDKTYSFLNINKIKTYDDLNSLFFQVLARKFDERNEDVKRIFEKVPYLNSSLFEPTEVEQLTLFISNLKDDKTIPIFPQTVLKDQHGKKRTGNISTLQYLFEFLEAYDFGAEGGEEIQEDNKTLINASVLGLIFEKINGYKDGSFFTPGFITMYMCRETIRKAVIQKFNEAKNLSEASANSPFLRGAGGVSLNPQKTDSISPPSSEANANSPLSRGIGGVSTSSTTTNELSPPSSDANANSPLSRGIGGVSTSSTTTNELSPPSSEANANSPLSRGVGGVSTSSITTNELSPPSSEANANSPLSRGIGGVSTSSTTTNELSPPSSEVNANSPLSRGIGGVSTSSTTTNELSPPSSEANANSPLSRGVGGVSTSSITTNELSPPSSEVNANSPLSRGIGGVSTSSTTTNELSPPSSEVNANSPLSRGIGGVSTSSTTTNELSPPSSEANANSPLSRGAGGVSLPSKNPLRLSKKPDIIPYNPKLKELARELRNNSTKSEIILWKELKGKFEGKYDFHRQKPLDNYIADFFCHELKLVIEIDGDTHNWEETQRKDFEKESRLNELGLNVLRFPDTDIFKHLEATLETIRQYIVGFETGSLSVLKYEDSPLNPLTSNIIENDTPLNPLSRGDFESVDDVDEKMTSKVGGNDTPLNPLSRGDFESVDDVNEKMTLKVGGNDTPLNPLSRGDFKSLDDIYEEIGDGRLFTRQHANQIVNSIKICDPAVGSGHFLVSALNEMIAVKNDLKILQDRDGRRLKEYHVEVVNDELIVTDEEGELFEYNPNNKESQRIQETLFHEKQTIIENCLFGVDINSNSVKICRLRLWIELLKSAYYKNKTELETLPNIDINIKCGNSLVSRFAIDADLKQALKKSKWTIDSYRLAVDTYRNAENKEQKKAMERMIADIKSDFRSEISSNDPKIKKLRKLSGELFQMTNQGQLFEMSKKEKADWNKKVIQLTEETKKLENEIEEIKANKIFENAFEWRFEFPEVLNDDGDFVGFDVVIGNPPWGASLTSEQKDFLKKAFPSIDSSTPNTYAYFIGLSFEISQSLITQILPDSILVKDFSKSRELCSKGLYRLTWYQNTSIPEIFRPFIDVEHDICTLFINKNDNQEKALLGTRLYRNSKVFESKWESLKSSFILIEYDNTFNILLNSVDISILNKLRGYKVLDHYLQCHEGIHSGNIREKLFLNAQKSGEEKPMFLGARNGDKIENYLSHMAGWYVDYRDNIIDKSKKEYASLRDQNIFIKPKIYLTRTGNPFKAFIDESNYASNNFFSIQFKDYEMNSYERLIPILGLLNSKFANYYIRKIIAPSLGNTFVETKIIHLLKLPINIKIIESVSLINTVNTLLKLKKQNPSADTTALESQIDQLVYQLYGLTEEEIKIIENS